MERVKNKILSIIKMLIIPIILVVLWQISGENGWIKTSAISTPLKIWKKFITLLGNGTLQENILISLQRIFLGFIIGSVVGIVLGILIGAFKRANDYLRLLLDLLRPIPVIVWIPILILWVGIGEETKVIVIAIGTFWPVFLNVMDGVLNVDKKYLEVATIFCKSRFENIFKIIIPATVPYLLAGLRIASGNALVGVVGAEMFASSSGLGYMVTFYREMNRPAEMMVAVIVIAILGAIVNAIIHNLGKKNREGNH